METIVPYWALISNTKYRAVNVRRCYVNINSDRQKLKRKTDNAIKYKYLCALHNKEAIVLIRC